MGGAFATAFAERTSHTVAIRGSHPIAIGAPLESLAHLMIADTTADAFRTVANITGDLMLVALFDRLRSLPESGDGVTIVPRAEAFAGAIQDLAQPIPGSLRIIDPDES
jgi:Na+/H+-dicarboxylate symporter